MTDIDMTNAASTPSGEADSDPEMSGEIPQIRLSARDFAQMAELDANPLPNSPKILAALPIYFQMLGRMEPRR